MSQAEAQTQAENKLARLGVQVEAMQAVLVRLLQDVVRAEHQLDSHQGTQLLQANEQLVVAALHSQADAAAAALSLKQAVLSPTLDVLTQLPNRATLHDHFLLALANAKRHGGGLALMFLDLDNFKQLNDSLGHAFGDKVLRLVADRLVTHVREVDTVSRHGGDEFLILLVDVNQPRDVQHIAEKLIQALSAPAEINGQRVAISASIGVAFCDHATDNLESLTARADAAMYHSKRQRLGGVAFHGLPLQAAFAGLDGSDDGRAPRPATHPSAPMHAELVPNSQHLPQPQPQPQPQRLHATLREANEKLLLATLSAQELQAAAEQTQRRQHAFVAAVADELRNPQAPIRIAMSMLGRIKTDEPLLPMVQEVVEQQLAHMSHLVGSLLDTTPETQPAAQRRHVVVDMVEVVARAVAAQQPAMVARGQHFSLHQPSGPLQVLGDPSRLEQIVSNLLDNATKHTHDKGHIVLQMRVANGVLTLTVQDDGIGITPAMLPFVFDPFVQDTRALGFNGVGLGIGLTVVRALVQAHGGTLRAHSEGSGEGSRFVVALPLASAASVAP